MKRLAVLCASLVAAGAILSTPLRACDVALALTVDVSGSVDPREYRLQMDGLARALDDGDVREALKSAEAQVAVMQWSGSNRQKVVTPWSSAATDADIDRLVEALKTTPRAYRHFSTAIGDAILAAAVLHVQIAGRCARAVIDVSGDGRSNEGATLADMRRSLAGTAITVNGLAIEKDDTDLSTYYREEMITGPGAFVVAASDFDDYARAIRRKLLREIATPIVDNGGSSQVTTRVARND